MVSSLSRVRNNNNSTIWRGSVLTGEEPSTPLCELKHALFQAGGPTQSQPSRPTSSRHHIPMEHRLRRQRLLLNPDTNAGKEKTNKEKLFSKKKKEKRKRKRKKRRTRSKKKKRKRKENRKRGLKEVVPPETGRKLNMRREIVPKLRPQKNQILSSRQKKKKTKKEKEQEKQRNRKRNSNRNRKNMRENDRKRQTNQEKKRK